MKNFLQVNRALAAEKNFTKLGSKLQANQSQMARNLHVIERRFSSTDRLSCSRSERSLTSEEASIQHPLSIHSASIEHPLGVGGNQVATRSLFRIWKYAAMITLLLTLACGQMWGEDYQIAGDWQTAGIDTIRVTITGSDKLLFIPISQGSSLASAQKKSGGKSFIGLYINNAYSSSSGDYLQVTVPSGYAIKSIDSIYVNHSSTYSDKVAGYIAAGTSGSAWTTSVPSDVPFAGTFSLPSISTAYTQARAAVGTTFSGDSIQYLRIYKSIKTSKVGGESNSTTFGSGQSHYIQRIVVTVTKISASAGCPAFSFHTGGSDVWNTHEADYCFTQVGSTKEWRVEDYTRENHTHYVVNWQGGKYSTGGDHSVSFASHSWSDMSIALARAAKVGESATGVQGILRLYADSYEQNLYVGFIPAGYVVRRGSDNFATTGDTESDVETVWRTGLQQITSSNAASALSVGLKTSSGSADYSQTKSVRQIFFRPNSNWTSDGAEFYIYYWGDETSWGDDKLIDPDGDGIYEGWIPASGVTGFKFVRENPEAEGKPAFGSGKAWNETGNLTAVSGKNLFTIPDGAWSGTDNGTSDANWSLYEKYGQYRVWADKSEKNFHLHFYPHYAVLFDAGDGSGSMAVQSVAVDAATKNITLAACSLTPPTGYEFSHWTADVDVTINSSTVTAGSAIDDEATLQSVGSDITLTAHWSPVTYTITLAKGTQGAANKSATVAYDATAVTSITHVTSTGYDLDGYYDSSTKVLNADGSFADDDVDGYITDGKWSKADNCTLTAKWTAQTYTITYKDGGNTDFSGVHIGSQPTSHTYNKATTLKSASKSGYVFGGWYDNSSCTGSAITEIGKTAYTADFTLYAKWTAMSMVDLESGELYTASDMVPAGVSLTSSYKYYPGVSTDQRFNVIGTGDNGASETGPMGAKTEDNTIDGTAFTEVMNFNQSASPSDKIPAHHALQFKIPAAGQLEIWITTKSVYLSNGTTEYEVDAVHKTLDVTAGTWYLYAKNSSKKLAGIRYKKTHSVSAVTSTGDNTKGTVSASPTTVAEDSASTITAVPAAGYQVTNWAVSGTGSSISPNGSSSSTTTTLTMGTEDATVTVTFGDASYGVTHTLSNATKSSGETTATHGTNYTAVFTAADGCALPTSITVTIGGETATKDTEYTWDKSTGTVEIGGSYITGAIVITVTGTVACSAPSAPSISGTQIYAVGDDIELTATCASGADGSTTYTWYKGADWATASAASPVQAAATGSSGYTLTISGCTADAKGLYWCEASNGSGCESHNTTGYSVDVPLGVHTITWTLKTGEDKSYVHTQSKISTSSYLTLAAVDTLKNAGSLSIGTGSKSGLTEKIAAPASKDNNKYMYVTFTVADGYQFTPDSAWCVVQAVGDGKNQNGNLVLVDNSGHSIDNNASPVSCPGTKSGSPTKVKITNGGSTAFIGSVTLKIYVYGTSASYRLGETINIKGTVEEAATYTISYDCDEADSGCPDEATDQATLPNPLPSAPTKDGYTFVGWFTDSEKTEAAVAGATLSDDVTLYAKWGASHSVTWKVNGAEYTTGTPTTTTCEELGITTMPTAPSALTCSDSFRGWSETNLYGDAVDTPPTDLFATTAGAPTIDEDKTFYAVFADADDPDDARIDEEKKETSFTSVFSSKAWADAGSLWTSGAEGYQMSSGRGVNVTEATTGAYATTASSYKGIKEVIVTYSTNESTGAGAITIEVGGTAMSASAAVTKTGGTSDRTITYTPASADFLDGNVKITVTCSTNSLYIKSVQVIYSGYHNYRCICPTWTVTPKLVTASTPIFITSAAEKTVRSQDSLQIVASGLRKNATLSISSPASKFELRGRKNGLIKTDEDGAISMDSCYIYYTPGAGDTSDGLDNNANFTITDGTNEVTVSQALIGRHLPANFVIAVYKNSKWYALPANHSSGTPAPAEIEVDNTSAPTMAVAAEANVYSLEQNVGKITTGDGQYVRLAMHGISPTDGSGYAPLFGANGNNLGRSGNSTLTGTLSAGWWWQFTQQNTSTISSTTDVYYYMSCPNNSGSSARVRLYNNSGKSDEKWGQYASDVDEIRLIPWNEVYTLTWNTNGGSDLSCTGTCTSGLLAPGADIVAPSNPTLSNYTFDGWKTADDGTGDAAAATMPSAATTYYAAWKQTVTLNTGSQGSGSNQTPVVYLNGTSVGSFTPHTASGYTLQGYYSAGSGGVKVLNADGTFAAANVTDYITSSKWSCTGAAPTLYAQWVASEDCRTLKYVWKVTGNFCDDQSTATTAVSMISDNDYFTLSGTGYKQESGKSLNLQNTQNNYFLLTAKTGYQIKSICFYGKVQDLSVDYTTDGSSWSALPSTKTDGDKYYTFGDIDASAFGIKLTAASPEGVWIRNMVIEVCAEGGTTYNVTYDGNDETGGTAPTDASSPYAYGVTVTVLGNTGDLAKTNYTFAGWTTNNNGTGSSYEAGSTFSITDNTTLYAKWTQAVTFDANTANHGSTGGSATAVWNATGLTGITHATPASGYKLLGYYTAATSGTKVLNSDGSFAETDVTDYITDGKWSRTGEAPTLYAQYEVAGSLTWTLTVNSGSVALGTESKTSSFTEISTSKMTNATAVGIEATADAKKNLTGKIETPSSYDGAKYVKVTFKVAEGYEFTPSSITVKAQPITTGKSVRLSLTDGTNTITMDADSAITGGKTKDVILAGDGTSFKDSVTLLIYCFGATDKYRLGTPIKIEGSVEASCATMPDYESMSYTTLEYTVGDDASAISIVGGENIDTYLWKSNTTNDRSGGSAASGTNNEESYTPDISVAGTTYYWCEMTNTECGITIKSSAVAVTVSASKTNPTVTWDPKAKLNGSDTTAYYGGKDYTIKATLNSGWNGTLTADMMTAPAGIRLHDFTIDNSSNPKTIQATFDVQTGFDVDENDSIAFTLSLPETATYNALNSQKKVAYNVCSGGGSADEYLMPVDAAHIDNDSWKGAWVYEGTGMMCYGHGSSSISAGTKDANIKTLDHSMADGAVTKYYKSSANHFGFYTEKAITGVRMYVYTSNTKSTVSGVYISNSSSSSSTPSTGAISYEAEYYNDDDGLLAATNDGCTWVEITFASEVAAGKYGQINVSSNVYIAGIALISGSGAGASLTTTLGFASASVSKTQSDANFTNLATTSGAYANTLGAITYSSSNTSCATVNATTGEVDITATGSSELSTTITATLAASGCFKGATATYTLTVAGQSCDINAGTLAITSGEATKCASDNVTLSLSGHTTDGTTVTWYRGETDVTASVSENTLTTSEAGTYSVVVSDGGSCTVRSNAVTITNKSAEASVSKLVDEWYIKQGRLTPDVALFDVADATSWTVKKGKAATAIYTSDGTTTTTGLAGVGFKQVDNIVYLEGTAPTGIDAAANDTIIITVTDACGNSATSDSIVIHKQIATDKHVLAFVVTGTEKGGWTAGISADQTTELQLYKTLTENFDVVATNIYSTDDEQKLKEYYSQFDILCITDYPNTKTKGVNSKSYVDAIGVLIDIRPILTMEAWVSGLTNWKSKGISGTPKSPTTRQYSMLLQCKDHEIFAGTLLTKIGEGDETMYRVTMVDQTIEEYPTLDGYTPGSKGYDAGGKPALQGFEYTSSMSDLLPIGRIDDGAGNDLQVGIERQYEMEARLLVLGINSYAMERLKDDGEKVVVNALKYLMKKNAEDISDCSVYFDDASGDHKWNNPENWGPSYESLPLSTQEVRIYKPCIVDTVVRAASVKIIPDGKYSHGAATANGKLTIAPTGALIVDGKIYAATAPNFFEKRTTEPENLVVEANSTKTGTLIFDNEDGETQATIEMYSPSHWEVVAGKYVKYWSYVGMPIKDVHIPDYFYGAFTYYYNEAKGWEKRFDNDIMQPFEGIGLSMQEGHMETFRGTMVSTENTDIAITNHAGYGDGDNLIGNSWTAPIQIANFDEDDFGTCWATVYIFNTGKGGDTYVNATVDNDGAAKAGQWLGVPIGVAGLPEYTGLKVIPAMNAFLVHDTVSTGTTLHLDYNKLVREGADTISQINQPMRAPKQARPKKKDVDGLLRIRVVGETTNTDVWMLQDERFSERYDNGWEAYFSGGDNRSPVLYAQSAVGPMGIVALQDLDGTVLGFAPSRDGNDYTFTFYYRGDEEYYLNDLKLQQSVLIDGENNYNFTFEKGDTNRFYVSRTPFEAPQITTDVDNTSSSANQSTKAIKVIYNDKLYIIRGGRVYSADGTLVK